jgi:DNA repair protein SbcD/Mre11
MRFVHTADWHLGRLFHGVHLTEDQAHILDHFVAFVKDCKPDAILIAGDIYDRAVPPPEAVGLLDDVLSRLVLGLKVPVVLIAGNHDSPHRLGFGSRLLAGQRLHIFGSFSEEIAPIIIEDKAGPVYIYGVPYAEPPVIREYLRCDTVQDHDAAMVALIGRLEEIHPEGKRSVVVAHTFVVGGQECESERPLSVGGAGVVYSACFEGFDYVALGHLHRPQTTGRDSIRYSGSLLKYSFSEATHTKSVSLVEMDAQGHCSVEQISLASHKDVRCVEGHLLELLKGPKSGENPHDYLMVTLLDTGPILDAMGKLREVYPNVLHIDRPSLMTGGEMHGTHADHCAMNDIELFDSFFFQATGEHLTDEQEATFASVVDTMRQREREVIL